MLIIGHRGSAGTKPENSIASLREAIRVGADIVEFDVRTTKDNHAILSHDFHMLRTHHKLDIASRHTLLQLQRATGGTDRPLVTLEQALKETYGKILVNIEIKRLRGADPTVEVLKKFCKKKRDWDNVLISSFSPLALRRVRDRAPYAQLAMLHYSSPMQFMAWHRSLHLSAIGFHRLHMNDLSLQVAHRLGIFTYVYTVNRIDAAKRLAEMGVDGVVTNYPEKFIKAFEKLSD